MADKPQHIFKMKNQIQNYAWGSKTALTELFHIDNPKELPMAEVWMGAHTNAPSQIITSKGDAIFLNKLIEKDPKRYLGQDAEKFNNRLPYLFKILSAEEPLSLQVHPTLKGAREGFAKENNEGIPLTASHRNYKDDNHKPEIICALTEFQALRGFRPKNEITDLFKQLRHPLIDKFIKEFQDSKKTEQGLKEFYDSVMNISDPVKKEIFDKYTLATKKSTNPAFRIAQTLLKKYPMDPGTFAALFLNAVILKPGEAMFLPAGELHSYLKGTGIELMANSDNVLRGGCTLKHIDFNELLKTLNFLPGKPEILKARGNGKVKKYPQMTPEFTLSVIDLEKDKKPENIEVQKAEIWVCTSGTLSISNNTGMPVTIKPGESCFISAEAGMCELSGSGKGFAASTP